MLCVCRLWLSSGEEKSARSQSPFGILVTRNAHTYTTGLGMLLRLRRNASEEKNAEGIKKQPKAKRKTQKSTWNNERSPDVEKRNSIPHFWTILMVGVWLLVGWRKQEDKPKKSCTISLTLMLNRRSKICEESVFLKDFRRTTKHT